MQEILDILTITVKNLDSGFLDKKILVFSDQLTESRINSAKVLSNPSTIPQLQLKHFVPLISDFHACMNFGDAIYKVLANKSLGRIPGTLPSIKTFLSRTNIKPKIADC